MTLLSFFKQPSPIQQASKELNQARLQLLEAQRAQETYHAMTTSLQTTIKRLERFVKEVK